MYRMVKRTPLSSGQKYGDIIRDGELSSAIIQKFLESGTLVRVSTPPLSEIPDWEKRTELLMTVDIGTLEQLIKADTTELARKLKRPARLVKQWQDEAMAWLNPPSIQSG